MHRPTMPYRRSSVLFAASSAAPSTRVAENWANGTVSPKIAGPTPARVRCSAPARAPDPDPAPATRAVHTRVSLSRTHAPCIFKHSNRYQNI